MFDTNPTSTLLYAVSLAILFLVFAFVISRIKKRRVQCNAKENGLLAMSEVMEKAEESLSPNIGKIDVFEFVRLHEPIEDDLFIYSKIAVFSPITANVTVQRNGVFLLYGTCVGHLAVNAGGAAVVYGTLIGSIDNKGGHIELFGKIIGTVKSNTGKCVIHKTAQLSDAP